MPFCVIRSPWSLSRIHDYLGSPDDVALLKVSLDKEGRETNYTLALLSPSLYGELCRNGLDKSGTDRDFMVSPYHEGRLTPPRTGYTTTLFFPLPRQLKLTEKEVADRISGLLDQVISFQDLPPKSYQITIPMKSRISSTLKGSCFVSFTPEVPMKTIILLRQFLDGLTWTDSTGHTAQGRCYWAAQQK